jgi:hypothetical protein
MTSPGKKCNQCGSLLILGENWAIGYALKYYYLCKKCSHQRHYRWARENREAKNAIGSRWRKKYLNKQSTYWKEYRVKNAEKLHANKAKHRAVKKRAVPAWKDDKIVEKTYAEAYVLDMHVDHVIPLCHPLVCGLHWEHNLQLLSESENLKKSNRFDFTPNNTSWRDSKGM